MEVWVLLMERRSRSAYKRVYFLTDPFDTILEPFKGGAKTVR
jgi:hypothetical protein